MDASYGAIAIQIIGFGLAGCVLHHIVLFFRHPERLHEIYHPPRKHRFDYHPRMTLAVKIYLAAVFIGMMSIISTFLVVLFSWSHIGFDRDHTGLGIACFLGFLGAAAALTNIAEQAKKAALSNTQADHEGDGGSAAHEISQIERAELQRLRARASADYQKIADLERTIATLQKKLPVTIRFEG